MNEFLARLGSEARERPRPTLKGTVVAAGAVLAVAGLVAIASDSYDGDTSVIGILLSLVAVADGYAVLLKLDESVRPAAIALISLGTIGAIGFVFDDVESPALFLLFLGVALTAQWGWGPARGSTIMLTIGLLSAWALLIDAASSDTSGSQSFGDNAFGQLPNSSFTSGDDTAAYLSLAIGGLLLFWARRLDRGGWKGIATSAVIVGNLAFVVGVFGAIVGGDSAALGSLLAIAAGIGLALVGATGERRFTTWLGGLGIFVGLVALLFTIVDDSAIEFSIVAVLLGGGLIVAGAFVNLERPGPLAEASVGESQTIPDGTFASNPTPATAPSPVSQGWYPDPSSRHELRWHDGNGWTTNVSDGGQAGTDEGV